MSGLDVAILGRIGYDFYSEEPGVPLAQARTFSRYLGGSSANMAVGLSRLGARVGIVSCLGTDSLSDFLAGFLQAEGVDTKYVARAAGALPSLAITEVSPPDRFPQVFYRRDPADVHVDLGERELAYAASGRMFITNGTALCASPSRESTYLALERARVSGCKVVFDVDYRSMSWRKPEEAGLAVRLALPYIDVLIGNDLELKLVAGGATLEGAVEKLRPRVPMLVSKLGDQGTRVWAGGEPVFLPPYRVEVLSTIGAGDGFASGFLFALLAGRSVLECLHYGNAAAAIVVSRLSCSEAMPTLAEVEALVAKQA
ncbi:MAG: 5-dehydro-2-deoxygluconokinase [Bryobacteraceae bacterium]